MNRTIPVLISGLFLLQDARADQILTSCIATGVNKSFSELEAMAAGCCSVPSPTTGLAAGYALPPSKAVRMKFTGMGLDFSNVQVDQATYQYVNEMNRKTKSVIVTCSRPKP